MYTLKDVAKLANVSTATASRALSNPDKVNQATQKKVRAAAKKLGYSVNIMARSLRKQESKTVLAILPDIGNSFFFEIIHGIELEALKAGYKLLLVDEKKSHLRSTPFEELLISRQVDGIILLTTQIDTGNLVKEGHYQDMPVVTASDYFPENVFSNVQINNAQSAENAVQYLCSVNHKKIATITGPMSNIVFQQRLLGYKNALAMNNIAVKDTYIVEGDLSFQSGYNLGRTLLNLENPPSAIFCQNDDMAIGLLNIAKELSVAIPKQLSVVGFNNIPFSEYCEPSLTTVHQPRAELGETAMKLLLERMQGNKTKQHISLPTQLIVRQSTAKFGE